MQLQIWSVLILGAIAGLGIIVAVSAFVPKHVKVSAALEVLGSTSEKAAASKWNEQLGTAMQRQSWLNFLRVDPRDLDLTRTSSLNHATHQAVAGVAGLILPPVLGVMFTLITGLPVSTILFSLPLSFILALVLMYAVNLTVTQKAKEARQEFSRAVATYIELVAAERRRNSTPQVALTRAAEVADSWVFKRLQEELQLAKYQGIRPWDSFKRLSKELGVPELADLADLMKIAGTEGASVYEPLRNRGKSLRIQMLNDARTKANADTEKTTLPMAMMGVVFIVLIATPALTKLLMS